MKFLVIFVILLGLVIFLGPAFGYTASKFASDYGQDLSEGQKIKVLVKVKGEPESNDPIKRAKEIRHLQSAVLKFCSFAGAINVKSDTWENEFTATVTTSLAKVLEERIDVISVKVIDTPNYQEGITSKIWLITSDEFGCSQKNQDAMEFLQSISFVYFALYDVKSEFDTSQCLYLSQIENDPQNFLYSLQDYDLPIIVFDSKITSKLISGESNHHQKFVGYDKPHIVFTYGSIPAKSQTASWELSHQLSHFILDFHGEEYEISEEYVHEAEAESVNCINIRRQEGLCSNRWTPVFGDPALTMMAVKIYPQYLQNLNPLEQLSLSQEQKSDYQDPVFRNMIYDLVPNVDLQIKDMKIVPILDDPKNPLDDTDVIVIELEVSNQGIDYFVLSDKMFKILVLDPSFSPERKPQSSHIIDNYSTSYDVELETSYDDYDNLEIFEGCEFFNDRMLINQTKTFSLCFDVLRKWNNEILNIDGSKQYFLTLMDNEHYNSCPNCKEVLLSTSYSDEKHHMPEWIQKILEWHLRGLISNEQYQMSIEYLVKKGIITEEASQEEIQLRLAERNRQLKDYQDKLLMAQNANLYVSATNFYEPKYSDEFSGVLCKRQNNIVTLSGDYTNDGIYYDTVFFKLILFDEFGNVVATGLSKIVDVTSEDFRNFSVSSPYRGNIDQCLVKIDSKFTLR
jgi:hypothetical protein